ncbi:hypothetical protein [Lentilactobacillus farraginis]|uniref:Uncharacterized protein n=1 Tax=Lentilactobacillus farraginis DSM 18382 = JCM 14108 TaxID=1423743 RepID=A0A0R1V9C1_9LACO|nr:hypothetical protein [Lentilactobacillus farraginis]KRM02064.1 hypothetical protein FD41_GL001263 [Lentilactobacillus farraginis DSM 18382 = JCM 14108]
MKRYLFEVTFLLTIILGVVFVAQSDISASHAYHMTPISFRRTWYHYEGRGDYSKLTFSKFRMSYTESIEGHTVHSSNKVKIYKLSNGWWQVYGRGQTAGAGSNYKVGYSTAANGKKRLTLFNYYGNQKNKVGHYYTSKVAHH